MRFKSLLLIPIILVLTSCAGTKPRVAHFKEVAYHDVDGWDYDNHSQALKTFRKSCEKIMKLDFESPVSKATSIGGSAIDWQVPCMEALLDIDDSDRHAKGFFEKWFKPYQIFNEDWTPEGMLTGYFQIELEGSKKKNGKYKYPVYKKPSNLDSVKGSSDIEHAAINNGALHGKGLEVAYVDNRARLYFMHIQGSGVIKLREGGVINLGFDGHNGYRFRGISEALKDRGLKFDNAKSMMDYLHKNPSEARNIMEQDPSYVFFRKMDTSSAVGGQGTHLDPERSLAVDYGLYPYGMPVWVSTALPEKSMFAGRDYKRLFIAQDTGGAIRGAIRGDVFFGRGSKAEQVASHFKAKGKFFALLPKTIAVPDTYTSRN